RGDGPCTCNMLPVGACGGVAGCMCKDRPRSRGAPAPLPSGAMSHPPHRLLLGPGPSNIAPRVLDALARPLLGHLDPAFLEIADEVQVRLRRLFGTENRLTIPLSATGSGGMEACFANLVEPGDTVLIGVAGVFGERMSDVAARHGAGAVRVEALRGSPLAQTALG